MKLYMFLRVRLSIIRSLFTVHSAMVYVIQVSSRSTCSCSTAVYKPVWHIPLLSVQWINSWWWTDQLSETRRFSWQNKFVKLVHLVGFITKTLVTMHGHMNVKICVRLSFTLRCSDSHVLQLHVLGCNHTDIVHFRINNVPIQLLWTKFV
jgi:hypothetical protein